ncbi:MAG: acyloxyacyl hydrolase [Bacteroidota bacterium]
MRLSKAIFTSFWGLMMCLGMASGYQASAGNFPEGMGFEAKMQYGFIIRHHLDMGLYTDRLFMAFEANTTFQASGKKLWHQNYALPEFGISYFYSGLGNTKILGDVNALIPWIRFPLLKEGGFGFSIRIGLGMGYFKSPFEQFDNYKNLSIGSHLNAGILFDVESRIPLTEKIFFNAGLSFHHFSNGVIKSPDYGINIPMITAGFLFIPRPRMNRTRLTVFPPVDKKTELRLSAHMGVKQIKPMLGPLFTTFCFSGDFFKAVSKKSKLGAGLDVFFDTSDKVVLQHDGDTISHYSSLLKPGVKGMYELDLGQLRMFFELGLYLYGKDKNDGPIYHKLGIKYFLSSKTYVCFTLKTHYARADYISAGFGYTLFR